MVYLKFLIKNTILFLIYGITYYCIEIAYRGYSHWSMLICGGICGFVLGNLNEFYSWETPFWKQILVGDFVVLAIEFVTGYIVNICLQWNVWDYSSLPFNLMGQICLTFAILWIPLIMVVIVLDDYLRYWWFNEEKPRYKLWR